MPYIISLKLKKSTTYLQAILKPSVWTMIEKIYQVNFTWKAKNKLNTEVQETNEQMNLPVFFNQYTFLLSFEEQLRRGSGFPDCFYARSIDFMLLDSLVIEAISAIRDMCFDAVHIVYEIPRSLSDWQNSNHPRSHGRLNFS